MARKFDLISQIYSDTVKEISTPNKWTDFLRTACYNFKLRFDEQLLVYAQKPEATAVLPIERWNKSFGRWVNRGAKGIAVFEKHNGVSQRLIHYFDISDTHSGEYSKAVPIWNMKSEYTEEIINTLEDVFGEVEENSNLDYAIISASGNAVEDNIPDYVDDLFSNVNNTFLEGLEEGSISSMYRKLVSNSVAYMIMTRLGINTEPYFDEDDFRDVVNFNSEETITSLGVATSAIAEMGLSEISKTILSLNRQNRIIAETSNSEYTNVINNERSFENGRSDLHNAGRLYDTQPDTSRTATGGAGTLRTNEKEVSVQSSQDTLHKSVDQRDINTAPLRNSTESVGDGRTADRTDVSTGRTERTDESNGADEMDRLDEQHQTLSSGNSESTSDIRINDEEQTQNGEPALFDGLDYDVESEFMAYPYFGVDEVVNEIFATTPHLKVSLEEIKEFFLNEHNAETRNEYVKGIFNDGATQLVIKDDLLVGYKAYNNGVLIFKGQYENREGQRFLEWSAVAGHFNAMRMLGMLQSTYKPLPSINEQSQLIKEAAGRKNPAFSFSQEIIDSVITRGSGVSQGKMRIYEQFSKSLSKEENIRFLKDEYGIGGSSSALIYTGISESHDSKGIELSIGYSSDSPRQLLNWKFIEKRISELIKLDRYLNTKEKEYYPIWLDKQELIRIERANEKSIRDAIYTPPDEKAQEKSIEYEYHYELGAVAYIGASEYEILSVDDERVMLFDKQFPLFNKEMSRAEFDSKIKENPMNEHFRVAAKDVSERDYSQYNSLMQDYFKIKESNPDRIILFQIGDFYEALESDALKVADNLQITVTQRRLTEKEYVDMCGFPAFNLEANLSSLLEKGYDVGVSSVDENGERSFIVHNTDTEKESSLLEEAREIISAYMSDEFEDEKEFEMPDDLSNVNLAYTTTEDEVYEITANANFVDYTIETRANDTVVRKEQFDSLEDMVRNGLSGIGFDDLVYVSEEELAQINKEADNSELIGKTVVIDDRKFVIEDINQNNDVSMRDITFEEGVGFPIFRSEKVDYVRNYLNNDEPAKEVTPAWEISNKPKAQTFDLHPDIPLANRNTFDLKSFELEEVGKKARYKRNVEAIKLLKQCETENRFATPDEQKILAQYVGWGGIPEAFDRDNAVWENEADELFELLNEDEYNSARESTLTAFYTPPVVISAIYKSLEQMGFRTGNVLEPSCGIGNFIGMLPQNMEGSRVYGVEIDKISAGIAQQLYQRSSIAAQPFEKAELPDSFFDVVVGNVPFGDFSVADKRYDKNHFLIHDYFFAKSIDKLRPGGVIALVTSKGTMDKENSSVRKYIAQRAELLGAIRLPSNTFKGNAGTEVVSDILILQKRDRIIDIEPDWVHLNTDENGIKMNDYFVKHPDMILGEMKMVSGRFGQEATCVPYENSNLENLLDEAIADIHGEIDEYEIDELDEEDNSIPADPNVRNFSYTILDDRIYFRENSRMTPVEVSATAENRIKGLVQIRDSVRKLLELQTEDYPESDIKSEMKKLNQIYDDYTKQYGLINSRANKTAFSQDSSYSLLSSLEVLNDEGNLERKADIFFKRTVKAHKPVTSVDTSAEALAVSMGEKAMVDMSFMCELTGKSESEIYSELKGVIFLNPSYTQVNPESHKYIIADEYLSGNVREKLEQAKLSAAEFPEDFTINVQALEKVQPTPLTASEISVRLGATWIPLEIVQQFIYEFLDTPRYLQWDIKLKFSPVTSEWNIENKSHDATNIKAYRTYGTDRINAYKIIEETLNLKDVRVVDYIEDEFGKRKAVLNKKETTIALQKQELIKEGFKEWIWKDSERREKICKLYNDKFNSVRPREYDGSNIIFSGMNPEIELREHQKNAVAHILYGGNTLLAHAVGAGKTYEMTAAAMESKRLGLCSKSLFVVPNHLTEQWAAEFLQLYPAANVLVATKKDFETASRKRFCGRIATGDYDAVIIGHSQFEKIPMSIERQRALLQKQIDDISEGIIELKTKKGENFSIKQLEKTKKSLKTNLERLNDQSKKDDVVTFEELGVDRIFIDESHYYKNLFLATKMRNVGNIAQTEAKKSSDLFMKCRYLDEITGGRGVVFATGTPISNSMVELYTIQRYLQYDTLLENGLQHFDAWASTFGETVTAYELKPEGTGYRTKTRFAKFYNLPELMSMFKEVADIKTSDSLNLPTPVAHYHNVAVKPSEYQKEMIAKFAERAEKVRTGAVDPSKDNMLKITNDGRKLALDQRMINPMLPDFSNSKINACVDNIYQIWDENADKKSAQLVFCDLSTPKSDEEFSVYTDIRSKLIDRGIPEKEIVFIHEAKSELDKQELFRKVRKGDVRVLLGSTAKMGAGTNVQDKLIALHDIDCPWRPSDLEQRSGRIIRQGNENSDVHIYRYVTEETFDAYSYQLIEGKQKFSAQIMTSKSPVRSAEDIDDTALSYAEIKMLATGNPYIKEKMDLDIQVNKLKMLKSHYLSQKYDLEDKIIKFFPQEIALLTAKINGLKEDLETKNNHPKEVNGDFSGLTIKGIEYKDKAEAGNAIIDFCKNKMSADVEVLGSYRGFKLEMLFDTFERTYAINIKGKVTHRVTLGTDVFGNITRLDNALDNIETKLSKAQQQLDNIKAQLETAKTEVEKPFDKEEELNQKSARLTEINALLEVNKGDLPVIDGEPDEGDDSPSKNREDKER